MDYTPLLSESSKRLKSSKIRELFKMANVPGLISMAGGMPDSENLPFEEIKEIINEWDNSKARIGLQYGTTKGYTPLLETLKERMELKKRIPMRGQDIIITTGSQQALALASKILLDDDEIICVEIPSFIGAIASFYSFHGKLLGTPVDDEGMIIEEMVKRIEYSEKRGKKVKGIYVIPNFSNPSGITLSQERRKKLLQISIQKNIPIIEDDPYGDLYFYGKHEDYLPIKSSDSSGNVIYLGTFSKVLSPGIRVGWIVADKALVEKLELQKQSFDACTSPLCQLIALDYIKKGFIDEYVEKMRPIYRAKRDAILEAIEAYMPDWVSWTKPSGGLFVWITLPESMNSELVFKEAVKNEVAFVTGDAFLPEGHPNNYIRLTYGDLPLEMIKKDVKKLGDVLKKML
jgi:2-aminoadipate transaminase